MKAQSKAGTQFAALDDSDAGEGCAIFFSQGLNDTVRWRIDVLARLDTGADLLVGYFYVSPPTATAVKGPPTRQVAAAVCPGAKSWSVYASPADGSQAVGTETADITLASSKCCTAPVGVTRVGERYKYLSNTNPGATQNVPLLYGQRVTRIYAFGLGGGGSVSLGNGPVITVAAGATLILEPKAVVELVVANPNLTFTNVNWAVEYLESA